MKAGDKLIAIDPCVMRYTKRATLTVGKEYTVKKVKVDDGELVFTIIDDEGDIHLFPLETLSEFFTNK